MDSLLSIVQMPGGVPVATVGIDSAKDAGILAARIIGSVFPGRKVVPVECAELIIGLGSIHCLSQQQPAPPRA
jgi:agmatine/peptidylarginine deiminase